MGFEDFEPIFGEAKAEWSAALDASSLRPFLFYVHAVNSSGIRMVVTDFHSHTWEALCSVQELEDMRDSIGIGGPWSEFLDYVRASIKSEDVKLIMQGQSKSDGAASAKIVAQKSKGLPLVSFSLFKLTDTAASDAMGSLSLELYRAFKSMGELVVNEQERCCQLTRVTAAEQEKNEIIERQLDTILYSKKQKLQKMNGKATSDALNTALQDSPDKTEAQNMGLTKVQKRVVPAYRRAQVRGVLLQDSEDEAGS